MKIGATWPLFLFVLVGGLEDSYGRNGPVQESPTNAMTGTDDSSSSESSEIQATDSSIAEIQESVRRYTPAKQIVRTAPTYPLTELKRERESWVHITYCIDEAGGTQNIEVIDSIGSRNFERAAIRTIKDWQFEPAKMNDQPIWQSRNETYITFAIEQDERGASSRFARRFRRIGRLIEDGDLEAADREFWDTYEQDTHSLYEMSKLWSLRVTLDAGSNDMYRIHKALMRATAQDGRWIEKESYERLLRLRTQVEINLGKWGDALHSYKKLVESAGAQSHYVLSLEPNIKEIENAIHSDQAIRLSAEIRPRDECAYCDESWFFRPFRNSFAFENVAGVLSKIDVRCDNRRFESAVTAQAEWTIPDSWGVCRIHVRGEPGTQFNVLMLPSRS